MARRSRRYNDWGKTYKAFSQAIVGAGQALNAIATSELDEICFNFLRDEDAEWPRSTQMSNGAKFGGDHDHPWYSGQLHDSVATRIMSKNKIVSVQYMPQAADSNRPQHTETIRNIIGAAWARDIAEGGGARYLLPGVQVQLIVAVPYTDKVNQSGRHLGFADSMANELSSRVNQWIMDGGLTRPYISADENGNVTIKKRSNVHKG